MNNYTPLFYMAVITYPNSIPDAGSDILCYTD